MAQHRFKVGQTLNFTPHRKSAGARPGMCKVTRQVSTDGEDPQYRVKCTNEAFERIVRESELG
jgi:hypothetical protein